MVARKMQVTYFDGKSSVAHPGQLLLVQGGVQIRLNETSDVDPEFGASAKASFFLSQNQVRLSEGFRAAPLFMYGDNGVQCQIDDPQDQAALRQHLHYQPSLAERWQAHWWWALLAALSLVATLYFGYVKVAPLLAQKIVHYVPVEVDEKLGDIAMRFADEKEFKASAIDPVQAQVLQEILDSIQIEPPTLPLQIVLRRAPVIGANAFAFPNGQVVVTDEMVKLLVDPEKGVDEHARLMFAALFAHEMAHVQKRHSMLNLIETSLVGVAVNVLVGDVSTVLSLSTSVVLKSAYSREREAEADAYAIRVLKQNGISPIYLALMFERLKRAHDLKLNSDSNDEVDETLLTYLSSHPDIDRRIQAARDAAKNFPQAKPSIRH